MKLPRLVCVPDAMKLPPLVSGATPAVAAAAAAAPVRIHLGREHDRGPARGVVPRGRRALVRGRVLGAEVGRLRAAFRRRTAHRVRSFARFDSSSGTHGGAVSLRRPAIWMSSAQRTGGRRLGPRTRGSQWPPRRGSRRRRRAGRRCCPRALTSCRHYGKRGGDEHAHDVRGLVAAVAGALLGDHVRYGGRHVGHGTLVTRSVRRVASSRQLRKFAERLLTLLAALLAIARAASSSPRASNRHADQLLAPSTACAIGRKVNGPPLPARYVINGLPAPHRRHARLSARERLPQ